MCSPWWRRWGEPGTPGGGEGGAAGAVRGLRAVDGGLREPRTCPRDIIYGHDLFLEDEQARVVEDLQAHKPGLVWVALPCTKWSPWQRLNYAGRKQMLRCEKQKQRKLIRFSVEVAKMQLALGGMVVFEHPRWSDMWADPSFRDITEHPAMIPVDCDMCRFNLRARSDGGLHFKPTRLLCSNSVLADRLARPCTRDHPHTEVSGQNTRAAGAYTREFAMAVARGYEEAIRRSIWTAYAAEDVAVPEYDFDEEELLPAEVEDVELEEASAITFPAGVSKTLARALRRVHQNLGHPRREDLVRHLRLAGLQTRRQSGTPALLPDLPQACEAGPTATRSGGSAPGFQ